MITILLTLLKLSLTVFPALVGFGIVCLALEVGP